ncbi:MAG: thiazole biosynthesis adenylyltransferase ThiF [Myxococcales bacterium]|nr:MAG: thiazole biosynthesis adenylyltransferase ThiF [Myxococcales bacterium]
MTAPTDDRYSRQILLPQIGAEGQARLAAARALIVGAGALGSHAAETLARAGVGRLVVVDRDIVEPSNLPRQALFTEADAAEALPKAVAVQRRLAAIASACRVEAVVEHLDAGRVEALVAEADGVIDGADNFETRYLLNDACVKLGRPWVYAGVIGTTALTMAVVPGRTPCLRCLFDEAPPREETPTCDTAGVLSTAVRAISAFQVTEALKILVGRIDEAGRALLRLDVWTGECSRTDLNDARRDDCPCCVQRRFPFLEPRRQTTAAALCGRQAVQVMPGSPAALDLDSLAGRYPAAQIVARNAYLLRLRADEAELTVFADGRAIVSGIDDPKRALALYARYVGH